MPHSPGPRAARRQATVPSKCGPFGRCNKRRGMLQESDEPARAAAEMVARQSYGKLVAFLAARTGDVAGAEDALSEAFASALADWSANGVPRSPEAWLLTAARRKLIDAGRRRRSGDDAADQL